MNVFILTDLEGISEVDSIDMMDRSTARYQEARMALMKDANTAVSACFDAGAERVFILDGHGGGGNFITEMLDPRAELISIIEMNELAKNGGFEYCVEIGSHAMAGTIGGFLDHTMNSKKWFEYSINGTPFGEVERHALFFSAYGIKIVFVSGDDAVCNEAGRFIKGITAVAVKKAEKRNTATTYDAEVSRKRIYDGVISALASPEKIEFIEYSMPLNIKLTLYRTDMCEEIIEKLSDNSNVTRLDARTLFKTIEKLTNYNDLGF